ncbi:hypothetical protein N7507_010397 [Penicillium longicatenatum]|nr:hypothetical protein N7507_010397 [Penicillium longicatenatum]
MLHIKDSEASNKGQPRRHAQIIPLKKPNKEKHSIAKAWRPISLLATLGKILESVVAERISLRIPL